MRLSITFAVIVLAAVTQQISGSANGHLGNGLRLLQLERFAEAETEFHAALDANPGLAEARFHLGECRFRLREYADARNDFDSALKANYSPRWSTYYLARLDLLEGKIDSSIARLQSLNGAEPLEDEQYWLGTAYLKKGNAQDAASAFERQIASNRRDFRAHQALARTYVRLGRRQDAEREFQETDRLHNYYLEGQRELVRCRELLQAGRDDVAWDLCGRVLKTDDVDKLLGVGMLFGEFRNHDRAMAAFRRALELDPDSPETNYDLGFTYFQMKQYSPARDLLARAVENRPDFFEALALYGTVLYIERDDAAARAVIERAHQLRPGDEALTRLLAQLKTGN